MTTRKFSLTGTGLTGIASLDGKVVLTIDLSKSERMKDFQTFAEEDINGDNEKYSPRLHVYQSTKFPDTVSLVTRVGPGLRLNREQVQGLHDWLGEWLATI